MIPTAQSQIIPQMEFIRETLLDLVNQPDIGGDCVMVSNLRDLWEQASQNTEQPLVYVCYNGESEWSSNLNISALTHRVKRSWIVAVKEGRGHDEDRGQSLARFLPFVEQVRDTIRSMLGVSQDLGVDFHSIKPMSQGSQAMDCYAIEFSTQADLPPILTEPED
jgi:hypothetical protein